MTNEEQTQAFANDLDKLIDYYGDEFDLTYASILGILQMKMFLLCEEAQVEGEKLEDDV